MLLNYAEAHLFNSHVSYSNKGIHQKHLICIPHIGGAAFASLSHQTMFITLITLWYSDEHFHHLTPPESSIAEPLMSAAIIHWLNVQVEKSPTWNQGLGAAWALTIQRWRRIETIGRQGVDTIVNGNNRYHITFGGKRGHGWKHSVAQSNSDCYWGMCQFGA